MCASRKESGWETILTVRSCSSDLMAITCVHRPGEGAFLDWYATSHDGRSWVRQSVQPVLLGRATLGKGAVMCPHGPGMTKLKSIDVVPQGEAKRADEIGYATSRDGLHGASTRTSHLSTDKRLEWEQTGSLVARSFSRMAGTFMFYIGFVTSPRADRHRRVARWHFFY